MSTSTVKDTRSNRTVELYAIPGGGGAVNVVVRAPEYTVNTVLGANVMPQELFDALRAQGFEDNPKTTAQKVAELAPGVRFHSSTVGGLYPEVVYVKLANGKVLQSTTGAIFDPIVFTAGYSFTEIG